MQVTIINKKFDYQVVEPIREEILQTHQSLKSLLSDLCEDDRYIHRPKFVVLLPLLCYGKPDYQNLLKPIDALCQNAVLDVKRNAPRHKLSFIHMKKEFETPKAEYLTLKLHSVIHSKSIMSYDKILDFINEQA